MTKKNYSKYEAKEELVTLSFNHVLLHKKDTKIYQVIFLSLLNRKKIHIFTLHPVWALFFLLLLQNNTSNNISCIITLLTL